MFPSILFCGENRPPLGKSAPACFRDLNLDQLIDPIIRWNQEPELAALYCTPLESAEDVCYRLGIMKDLMHRQNWKRFRGFSREIFELAACQEAAAEDFRSKNPLLCNYLLCGHILEFGTRYCSAIRSFLGEIPAMELQSAGLAAAVQALENLCRSDFYVRMQQAQQALRAGFGREQYCMLIRDGSIRLTKYDGEEDLSARIQAAFQKFSRKDSKDYRRTYSETPHVEAVEAGVLRCLAELYPELFRQLEDYIGEFMEFTDPGLLQLCRELQFYLSWLEAIQPLAEKGLPFCCPDIAGSRVFCNDFYDLVLAEKIGNQVVRNSFYLEQPERILVVTGPNQGGKTTFGRAIGQIHYLASLGLCVPGSSAGLLLPSRILTHFEREESLTTLHGKLQDDLLRLKDLLEQADEHSLVLINEIFASTVLEDALTLSGHMMDALIRKKALCVIVTFLDELSRYSPETVSMVSTVQPEHPEKRTFRVLRRPADGLAYAMTVAERHGLTQEQILRRIAP